MFDQLDIVAALAAGTYLTGPYAAISPPGGGDLAEVDLINVPEPVSGILLVVGVVATAIRFRGLRRLK